MSKSRRKISLAIASIPLTSCVAPSSDIVNSDTEPLTIKSAPLPSELTDEMTDYSPQFHFGDKGASEIIEIGFSLHCGATRDWLRSNGKSLVTELKSGKKAAFFSHVVRSKNEGAVLVN